MDRDAKALVTAGLPVAVPGGTGNAWANPQPAETPRRLVLEDGFAVDGGRGRHLKEQAGALGFEDLGAYLQTAATPAPAFPGSPPSWGVGDWQVQAALARTECGWCADRSGWQRSGAATRGTHRARVAALGFADVEAYLFDRVVQQAWLLAHIPKMVELFLAYPLVLGSPVRRS